MQKTVWLAFTDLLIPPFSSCNITAPKTKPLFNTTKKSMEMLSACHSYVRPGRVMLPPNLSTKYRCALKMAHCIKEDTIKIIIKLPAL